MMKSKGDPMNQIIDELRYLGETFPREAVEKAIERKDETIPLLLEVLDEVLEDHTMASADGDYMLHLYSMYLLAQFREKRAFPKILELISLPPDDVEFMLDDVITESLPSMLYSTYNGDLSQLERVIENPQIGLFVRGSVLDVLGKLYLDGELSHEYLVAYLRKLIAERTYDEETESVFNTFIQDVVEDCSLFDMIQDIRVLYDEKRISLMMTDGFEDFLACIHDEKHSSRVKYIDDTIEEMHWWACFQDTDEESDALSAFNQLIARTQNIGRNEPCPCGSGKKYKKCCMD